MESIVEVFDGGKKIIREIGSEAEVFDLSEVKDHRRNGKRSRSICSLVELPFNFSD